jgi:hypothetical protein
MRAVATLLFAAALGGFVAAEDKEPHAARTTKFIVPSPHTHERAGTDKPYSIFAAAGKSSHESGGYIGGGKLVHGEGRGVAEGVFGWDYTFFNRRPGRIFLGWHNDSTKHQSPILPRYAAEGPRVTDVFALQPFKKAVREARHEKETGGKHE